jgi:ABC-type glutathione transport system ATPase component
VNGNVGEVLAARDQREKNEEIMDLLGAAHTAPPFHPCETQTQRGRHRGRHREGDAVRDSGRHSARHSERDGELFHFSLSLSLSRACGGGLRADLRPVLDRNVGDLSGGELQRFAIAVVAVQEADIYMFDEPSSYLDVKQRLKAAQV